MAVKVARLLTSDDGVPGDVRAAIAEGRMEDAGSLLMAAFDLTCEEAGQLVDRELCEELW